MVSMTTNPGHSTQHYMQVAHPAAQALPGQPQPYYTAASVPRQVTAEEYRRIQHQLLDQQLDLSQRQAQSANLAFEMERSRSNPESYNGMSLAALPADQGYQHHRPGSSRSDGPTEYKLSLHAHGNGSVQRPFTPPTQGNQSKLDPKMCKSLQMLTVSPVYSPMTPASTPFHQHVHSLPEQLSQTLNPSAMAQSIQASRHGGQVESVVYEEHVTTKQARRPEPVETLTYAEFAANDQDQELLPSPPHSAVIKQGRTFDVTTMPAVSFDAVPQLELHPTQGEPGMLMGGQEMRSKHCDVVRGSTPPQMASHQGCQSVGEFGEFTVSHSPQESFGYGSQYGSPIRGPISPRGIPMEDLSLEATIEDTGVSSEEVQSYIAEPTEKEIKWTCLFPECGKKFGRKENIRSHVQTHLGDRQFKCIHCHKCFVRQHDLKRHSKIHSGVKPYLCRCGADFARHDALTRHRTRGVCIGAFEGVVKKYAKRGRPKKEARPDDEERYNKSARTQRRVAARAAYTDSSSVSGTDYNSSWPNSPEEQALRASVELELQATYPTSRQASPQETAGQQMQQQPAVMSFAPSAFSVTPPQSPDSSVHHGSPRKTAMAQHGAPSPAASQDGSNVKQVVEVHQSFQVVTTQANSHFGSQADSPPELSHSSPPTSAQMMDFDFSSSGNGVIGLDSGGDFESRDFNMFEAVNGETDDLFGEHWATDNPFFSFDKASTGVQHHDFAGELDMY